MSTPSVGSMVAVPQKQPSPAPAQAGQLAAPDVQPLIDALTNMAEVYILNGIKKMTTGLDEVFIELTKEFEQQVALCDSFRKLAARYRPIRNEAITTVVKVKYFADTAATQLIPMLKAALDDGSVVDTKAVIDEILEMYMQVVTTLKALKVQHDDITMAARAHSDEAAKKAQESSNHAKEAFKKGQAVSSVGAVVLVGGATISSGPVGWLCFGSAVAALGNTIHTRASVDAFEALNVAAKTINTAMNTVTQELEEQCSALQKIVTHIECACNSTGKIQILIDSWSQEGKLKSNMEKMRLTTWLAQLPIDMLALSGYCTEYLGAQTEQRLRLMNVLTFDAVDDSPIPSKAVVEVD